MTPPQPPPLLPQPPQPFRTACFCTLSSGSLFTPLFFAVRCDLSDNTAFRCAKSFCFMDGRVQQSMWFSAGLSDEKLAHSLLRPSVCFETSNIHLTVEHILISKQNVRRLSQQVFYGLICLAENQSHVGWRWSKLKNQIMMKSFFDRFDIFSVDFGTAFITGHF